jgi:hypothetical protein
LRPFARKFWAIPIVCLCACAVAGGVAVASGSTGSRSRHAVAPFLVTHFALFQQSHLRAFSAHTASGTYPAAMKLLSSMADPSDPDNQREGLDVAATQEVSTPNGPIWVVPGSTGACVITSYGGSVHSATGACALTSKMAQKGLGLLGRITNVRTGVDTLFGIVPNGVSAVQLGSTTGPSTSTPVVDNGVIANVPHLRHLADGSPDLTFEH